MYDLDDKELKSLEQMEQVLYAKLLGLAIGPWMISRLCQFTLQLKMTIKTIWVSVLWKTKPGIRSAVCGPLVTFTLFLKDHRLQWASLVLHLHALNIEECPSLAWSSHYQPLLVFPLGSDEVRRLQKTIKRDLRILGSGEQGCVLFCPTSCREWWGKK